MTPLELALERLEAEWEVFVVRGDKGVSFTRDERLAIRQRFLDAVGSDSMRSDRPTAESHRHRCMRCKQEFECQTPGICTAQYDVLPNIVLPDLSIVEHCTYQPTERFRGKP